MILEIMNLYKLLTKIAQKNNRVILDVVKPYPIARPA
jgi:hypothetical protein